MALFGTASRPILRMFRVNGEAASAKRHDGDGWAMYRVDLSACAGRIVVEAVLPIGDAPFGGTGLAAEAWVLAEATLGDASAPGKTVTRRWLPRPLHPDRVRTTLQAMPRAPIPAGPAAGISDEDLAKITAAKLRLDLFDVNGGEYADKWIEVNGVRVGRIPAHRGDVSRWQEVLIDLPAEAVRATRRENRLVLTNSVPPDSFKFRGAALAVRRPDGRWVSTPLSQQVYSSAGQWLHAEGDLFEGARSPEIRLVVP